MTTEHPNEADIFNTARQIASLDEREVYLAEACDNDAKLRERVDKLLAAFAEESQFLEQAAIEQETIIGHAAEDLAASMEAGLAPAFGDANHSVLRSLSNTLSEVPRVSLRESQVEVDEPIARPNSPEVPKSDSDCRYRLDGEIARGGMGAIIKGRDTDLGRDLAIKVLLDSHRDKPEVIQRFVEEAQIGGQLQHPGIAPIYELGQFGDKRPFFAMKLVKGQTLSKLLADRKDAADERSRFIGIFEQVCQTMAYAHSRGVIHRDLKPANIMVGAFGEVQVMDWGLAKVLQVGGVADEKKAHDKQQGKSIIQTMRSGVGSDSPEFGSAGSETQMGSVMGTPAYMPPEQALGEIDNMDERADVFGLGAILCEILTSQPPYVGDDGTQVYRMASRGKLEDAFSRLDASGADADLIALTKHCLELEPVDRPRDAGVLAERVTGYLESVEEKLRETEVKRAAEAARADAEEAQAAAERQRAEAQEAKAAAESARANEERKRRRTSLALAASVLLLISLGGGGWLYMERQESNRQTAEAAKQRQHAAEMQTLAEQRDEQRKAANQARDNYRDILYKAEMQVAERAWQEGNIPLLKEILERHKESKLRGFEWYYLSGLYDRSLPFRQLHIDKISGRIAFSSDESKIVAPQGSGNLALHDVLDAHATHSETSVAYKQGNHSKYFPDSHVIVSRNDQGALTLWDANSLTPQDIGRTTDSYGKTSPFAVTSKETGTTSRTFQLAVFNARTSSIDFWNFSKDNSQLLTSIPTENVETAESVSQLLLSSNATYLVLRSGDDTHSHTKILNIEKRSWLDKTINDADRVSLSPDGKYLAARHRPSNEFESGDSLSRISVYSLKEGSQINTIVTDHRSQQTFVFHPLDPVIAISSMDSKVRLWRFNSDEELRLLEGHRNWTSALAFSPDGRFLASGAADNIIHIWDVASGAIHRTFKGHVMPINRLAFSPSGGYLASTGLFRQDVNIWRVASGEEEPDELLTFDDGDLEPGAIHQVDTVAISGDASLIACADRTQKVSVWETATGKRLHVFRGFHFDFSGIYPGISVLAIRPNGEELAVVDENSVKLFALDAPGSGESPTILKNPVVGSSNNRSLDFVCVSFSPDGRWLVAGMRNCETVLWDLLTGTHQRLPAAIQDTPRNFVRVVEVSPDSRTLAVGASNTLAVWRLSPAGNSWEKAYDDVKLSAGIWDLSFSPDGREILLVVGLNRLVSCLTETGEKEDNRKLDRHTGFILAATFLPDGRVLTGGSNMVVNCWDYERGDEYFSFAGHTASILSLSVSNDGETFVSSNDDGSVRIWRASQDGYAGTIGN